MVPISLRDLSKRFTFRQGGKKKGRWAVKDLSLEVRKGTVFGFLGPNGAGKTTTIKMMMGLTLPTEGEIFLLGKTCSTPTARVSIGFLPENPLFPPTLTGWEIMLWAGQMVGMKGTEVTERAHELLARVRLLEAKDKRVSTYSKGMIQRLGVAQAVLNSPALLILDEPLSGLDPSGRQVVTAILNEAKKEGCTIFFSSHILADVRSLCDEVGLIVEGRLVKQGTIEEVFGLPEEATPEFLDRRFSEVVENHA